jgi:hypothetical protein
MPTHVNSALKKLLAVCCAVYLSGAHWVVLQAIAWTGMLVTRTQTSGVVVAVATTFDGDHPCRLCSAISTAQEEEKGSQPDLPALKAMEEVRLVITEDVALPPCAAGGEVYWAEFVNRAIGQTDAPPTPPPRTV